MSVRADSSAPDPAAMRRIVIVGNGIAGVTAADTLRNSGFNGEITLIGDEPHPAYSRPALSKALLRDDEYVSSHLLPPPRHGAAERLGVRVTELDVAGRSLALDDGDRLSFDGLVIATGCRPRRLGGGDAGGPEQLTLRTIEDALLLRERIEARPSVVVIGGGPLGMEIASGALEKGCDVTVVSLDPPMGLQLGTFLSELFVSAALARGLHLVRTGALRLERTESATRVVLTDGTLLEADIVVTAVGDVPNVEWLATSGLLRDGLLVTDERGQVAPGIVAAGDVAAMPTPLGVRRVPLWNSAIERARVAAAHLVGADAVPVTAHPYFWTEQFGLSLKAVGHAPFAGEPVVVDGAAEEGRLLLQWPGTGTPQGGAAVAVNYRIPIPKLRLLSRGD
jgi:3-phenylpropionate/trans-cinnamate dioxygenase ferredoxin reductase component